MTKRTVKVLTGAMSEMVVAMFLARGWEVVVDVEDADLLVFTGGEDVSPELYGEYCHATVFPSYYRDQDEMAVFKYAKELGVPMAGICRGAQFLNVMCGGTLWQDVDGHALAESHTAYLIGNLIPVQVSSTHHQMMRPNYSKGDVHVLMTAAISTEKQNMSRLVDNEYTITHKPTSRTEDIEALYYEDNDCLCFQPHPEINEDWNKECTEVFFTLMDSYLFEGLYEKRDRIPF